MLQSADAPARLPVSELMAGLPSKLMGLLLPLFFARLHHPGVFHSAHYSMYMAPRGRQWRVCRANSWACFFPSSSPSASSGSLSFSSLLYVHGASRSPRPLHKCTICSLRLSVTCIPASIALGATLARFVVPFAAAPFVDWVEHVETRELGLFNASLPVLAVDFSFVILTLLARCTGKFAAVQTMSHAVVAWLTAVVFNSAMLLFPVSVGRALLFAIPQLSVAGGLKSNDLFAISVGLCVISTIIAACRDLSACMTSGGTCLVALKRHLVFFIWMVIIPLLMGLLVDLSLISPFAGPDDDFPVLNFFCTFLLGRIFKSIWIKSFVHERLKAKLNRAKEDLAVELRPMWWFFQDVCVPVAAKLLAALGAPYVLAKGVFPRLGFSADVNLTVYRYAWSGCLGLGALCCLGKVLGVKMHDSIRDDRYIIGQRLQDVGDGC